MSKENCASHWHATAVSRNGSGSSLQHPNDNDIADDETLDQLIPTYYPDLLSLATGIFAREYPGHLLEPAALANETYLRLKTQRGDWQNREHFFAIAARLMRRILIDHARRRCAIKRIAVLPAPDTLTCQQPDTDSIELDRVLGLLATIEPRQHAVVQLRHRVGLTVAETAAALSVSPATVKLDWSKARSWLARHLDDTR